MGLHFIGAKDAKGNRGRFFGSYDEKEFETMMNELNWKIPKNYVVYHLEEAEIEKGSKRVDVLKKLPFIMAFNPFSVTGETYADAKEFMKRALREEQH